MPSSRDIEPENLAVKAWRKPLSAVLKPMPADAVDITATILLGGSADDLRRVRFSMAFRGYRMSEVDALLDRLAREREQAAGPVTETEVDPEPKPSRGDGFLG